MFYSLTKVTLGNGNIACFWNAPWADGFGPKCISPSIYDLSKRKTWCVRRATTNNAWLLQINNSMDLSVNNLQEFTKLWHVLYLAALP
jgi:hypothetical protein